VDAERALSLAVRTSGAVDFHDRWLDATLFAHRHRLAPLLRTETDVAGSHPHLASAVRAYAGQGFSVSAAARSLHLHPNTVSYRLERWRQLTGWDPRTVDGLTRSLLSLRLFPPSEPHGTA
jgi:DNA-binding PucR family transcriptional regulator